MKQDFSISIFLDTRRAKANGKFPVKLRAYTSTPRRQMLYPTSFEFTEKEFDSIWHTTKPRAEHKEARMMLQAMETKAIKEAEKIIPFNFEQFEKLMNRKAGDGVRVEFHFNKKITELTLLERLGTASSYRCCENSLKEFLEMKTRLKFSKLTFMDVTPDLLTRYEEFMITEKGNKLTSVGIYLRALRALFNDAIDAKDIEPEVYPFGRRKYQIPSGTGTQRALNTKFLIALRDKVPATNEQAKARAFWLFSYNCQGINVKDILQLRWKDIENGWITFNRAKTINTSKGNPKLTKVFINQYSQQVLDQFGSNDRSPNHLVFEILSDNDTAAQKRSKIQNFTRFINQHIKKLAVDAGLPSDISTYWARHSFANQLILKGVPVALISESLSHKDIKSTQAYIGRFDDETKKELAANLMEF